MAYQKVLIIFYGGEYYKRWTSEVDNVYLIKIAADKMAILK